MHNGVSKKSFTFFVEDDFIEKNIDSKIDKKNPKLTKAEAKLLYKILKQQKYCVNSDNDIFFKINSRQEKIYDVTFAHLIEQNYRAKPVSPRMYFGECLEKEPEEVMVNDNNWY